MHTGSPSTQTTPELEARTQTQQKIHDQVQPSLNHLDRLFSAALGRTRFYKQGWGDPSVLKRVLEAFEMTDQDFPIRVCWMDRPSKHRREMRLTGYFASPLRLLSLPMPVEAQTAYFELLVPADWPQDQLSSLPLCLHLAGTTDQGFAYRRRVARPLLQHGVGALILENPYYGWRRPSTQRYVAIDTLADQLMMNLATVLEGRALLQWFHQRGFDHLGVTGYSMGGYMAGYIACLTDFPLATVPCAVGISAERAFTDYVLKRILDWDSLIEDAGDRETAERWVGQLMGAVSFDAFDPPFDPELAIIVANRYDSIIPGHESEALARHWQVPIRWVDGGHISAPLRGRKLMLNAVLDAFGMLLHKYPPA